MSAGRVVESAEFWRHAWGGAKTYNPEGLHTTVYRLRLKLSPFGIHIETTGVGYRLAVDGEQGGALLPQRLI